MICLYVSYGNNVYFWSMISTSNAISLVNSSTTPLESTNTILSEALGKILSIDAIAQIDLPPFSQSAMDGYAIKFGNGDQFEVIGEIKAGDDASSIVLEKGQAIKIFTGAMCPSSADLVCRIEDIKEDGNTITIFKMPKAGANIRLQGEQIKRGDQGLNKGNELNPAAIGFLANLGIEEVKVYNQPKINIVSTGNELVPPSISKVLAPGKIFESNGIMLQMAIQERGFSCTSPTHLVDSYKEVFEGLKAKLELSDVLIVSGGISVGDYDFVGKALIELGVKQVFYKVNQKPGKPIFFGTKEDKLIFALPGNPAAALTCFYLYVLPALNKLAGKGFKELPRSIGKLTSSIERPNTREQFLKASNKNGEVTILEGQSSAMLRTFSTANALAYLPAETTKNIGDPIEIIALG